MIERVPQIMFKKEIGVEVECWLLDADDNIVEPARYGFNFDEYGFLVEIRSEYGDNPQVVKNSVQKMIKKYGKLARDYGFHLDFSPSKNMTIDDMGYYQKKYSHGQFQDLTMNIYPYTCGSHNTGYEIKDDSFQVRCTAGNHVHFSCVDETNRPYSLPVVTMVRKLDKIFRKDITRAQRYKGEYEVKPHHGKKGFEYRSLPTGLDIDYVVDKAFEVLNKT